MRGKIVFITGASSGIGEGCARKFASQGSDLILNARNVAKLEELKNELEATYGVRVFLLPFDVRDRKAATQALASLPETWKAIDVLVNNAGLVIGVDKEFEGNLDEWDIVIDTNIKSLLAITRLVVPGMVERGRGHIINIGSIAGDAAYPGGSVYCATKAAVKALSDGLRIDLVDTPLRVTNVKPGMVETNFSVVRYRGDKQAADNFYKGIRPLTGDDIAETVYFQKGSFSAICLLEDKTYHTFFGLYSLQDDKIYIILRPEENIDLCKQYLQWDELGRTFQIEELSSSTLQLRYEDIVSVFRKY